MLLSPISPYKLAIYTTIMVVFIALSVNAEQPELPSFLSIKTNQVNARTGPNLRYPVKWIYITAGEPLEVLASFEKWYKLRDFEGEESWVHQTMLSKKRFAVVKAASQADLYTSPKDNAIIVAKLEFGVRVHLESCKQNWCHVTIDKNNDGWLLKDFLWGVKAHEEF